MLGVVHGLIPTGHCVPLPTRQVVACAQVFISFSRELYAFWHVEDIESELESVANFKKFAELQDLL